MKKKWKRRLLPLCYAAAALLWLAIAALALWRDSARLQNGSLVRRVLQPWEFTSTSGVVYDEAARTFASTDPDPQFIYRPEAPEAMTRFVFRARPLNKGGGEMVLYYNTAPEQNFSEARKLWARRSAEGEWYFDLGGREIAALRFDPDSVGGVFWRCEGMVLNERIAPLYYFVPDAQGLVLLLCLPLLFWALLCEAGAFAGPVIARRRFESRWRSLEAHNRDKKEREGLTL